MREHALLGEGGRGESNGSGSGRDQKTSHDLSPSNARKSQTGIPVVSCSVLETKNAAPQQ
jgi:hypothetical protein